jgi:hypothetical protein
VYLIMLAEDPGEAPVREATRHSPLHVDSPTNDLEAVVDETLLGSFGLRNIVFGQTRFGRQNKFLVNISEYKSWYCSSCSLMPFALECQKPLSNVPKKAGRPLVDPCWLNTRSKSIG